MCVLLHMDKLNFKKQLFFFVTNYILLYSANERLK